MKIVHRKGSTLPARPGQYRLAVPSQVAPCYLFAIMDPATKSHLEALKEALHTLTDSGDESFEGLLAAVLSEVCGQPFQLASSGSQRGRDGDSAFDGGATYFEAKLYEGPVPRTAVASKLLELAVDDKGQVDTWALCATAPISAQHEKLYRQHLAKSGIGCLILDWPEHTLPPLGALLAMALATTDDFLQRYSTDKFKVTSVRANLEAIAADSQFAALSSSLLQMVREPTLGLGLVKSANKTSLTQSFSDRKQARQLFGQPLAPLDPTGLPWFERTGLLSGLSAAFTGPPDDAVFVVLGEEGTGKSWLVAKAWLVADPTPLLAVLTADELFMPSAMHDLEGTLIAKLAGQSEGTLTEASTTRWHRRFRGWRANSAPNNVRLVVWVDGLNQAQGFPWARWMDAAASFLSEVGGRLIVTTNERYFAQRLRNVAVSTLRRVVVTEWSEDELKAILATKGIVSDRLSADVFGSLRNPRILGIAIELLNAKDIEGFEELTVGRLLFEHIRRCERDGTTDIPAAQLAKALQTYADTVIGRLSSQAHDDLMLFDVSLDDRLKAVSESRFFANIAGDPDLYTIRDDGLPLALGLSLVGALRKEERNGRDPAARLADIIEPILALAKTSEVIFSALQVACLETDCPVSIGAALAQYYVGLQNIPDEQWPAFEAHVRASPEPFLQAARASALSNAHLPNMRWLTGALISARSGSTGGQAASREALKWLSYYSLAPERMMFKHLGRDSKDSVDAERSKRQAEIDAKLAALSPSERTFMETRLTLNDEKGLSRLHLLAFELLAGMPLAGASDAFVNWAFGNALHPSTDSPETQFTHLVRFNTVDWNGTRDTLLRACAPLMAADASPTGQWALVRILRATGHPEDATRANEIAGYLTKDRQKFAPTRRGGTRTETDPCDPASGDPSNIGNIVRAYEQLDISTLREGRGNTVQDLFFTDSRPGLARFRPDVAIAAHRRLAHQVVSREGLSKRQGILALFPDSALLDPKAVDQFIGSAVGATASSLDPDSNQRDEWISNQYALFAGLPHKNGNEQLAIIAALKGRDILLSTLQQASPADEGVSEEKLAHAIVSGDADEQARVLSFILYSRSPLSAQARKLVSQLLNSTDKMVRTQCLGIASYLRDEALLKQISDSGWDAGALDPKDAYYAIWYGSSALLAAAELGVLDPTDAVDRMSVSFYGFAVSQLPGAGAKAATARIDAALERAASLTIVPRFPLVEQPVPTGFDQSPPLLSLVAERQSPDIQRSLNRMSETDDQYQARQQRAWQAFDRFSAELTTADARIILDDFSWQSFDSVVSQDFDLAQSWATLLIGLPSRTFRSLHFFALGLAKAIAKADSPTAIALFGRTSKEPALINRVVGPSKIPAETVAYWENAQIPEIKTLCFERLDRASNDNELAVEVLAAFTEGMQTVVAEYVDQKLAIDEPAAIARALMVSGLSDLNPHATAVLERFKDKDGFIGYAYKAARHAYERNEWACHWFEKMRSALSPEDFWRHSVLFTKIVDGRYTVWQTNSNQPGEIFERFFLTLEDRMNKRLKKWQDKRQKTLFGQDLPDPMFLLPPVN